MTTTLTEDPPKPPSTPDEARRAMLDDVRQTVTDILRENRERSVTEREAAERKILDDFQKGIDERLKPLEERAAQFSLPGSEDPEPTADNPEGGYSYVRMCRAWAEGDRTLAPREWEMHEQLRAQATNIDADGGFLVPHQVVHDTIIPLLRPRLIVMELGVTEVPNIEQWGSITFPKADTEPIGEDVTENQAPAEEGFTFTDLTIEPKMCSVFMKSSRRFLRIGVGAEQYLRTTLARILAQKMNLNLLRGTGGAQPVGVINWPGVQTVDFVNSTSGAVVEPDFYLRMLEMEGKIEDADALMGRLGWAVATKFKRAARQIKSENAAAGTASLEMDRKVFTTGAPTRMLDYEYRVTTQLTNGADTQAVFGNWEDMIVATWGSGVRIEASNTANDALQKQQTHIAAAIEYGSGIAHAASFVKAINLDTASI